jgi:hypothetical protein
MSSSAVPRSPATLQAVLNVLGAWTNTPPWVFYAATAATIVVAFVLSQSATEPAHAGPSEARLSAPVAAS